MTMEHLLLVAILSTFFVLALGIRRIRQDIDDLRNELNAMRQ